MKAKAYIVHRAMCEPELEWSKPKDCLSADPLYTTPPQRKPMTDEDVERIVREARVGEHGIGYTIARATEAAHGIKEKST